MTDIRAVAERVLATAKAVVDSSMTYCGACGKFWKGPHFCAVHDLGGPPAQTYADLLALADAVLAGAKQDDANRKAADEAAAFDMRWRSISRRETGAPPGADYQCRVCLRYWDADNGAAPCYCKLATHPAER